MTEKPSPEGVYIYGEGRERERDVEREGNVERGERGGRGGERRKAVRRREGENRPSVDRKSGRRQYRGEREGERKKKGGNPVRKKKKKREEPGSAVYFVNPFPKRSVLLKFSLKRRRFT